MVVKVDHRCAFNLTIEYPATSDWVAAVQQPSKVTNRRVCCLLCGMIVRKPSRNRT
jgi:hypothetical protein